MYYLAYVLKVPVYHWGYGRKFLGASSLCIIYSKYVRKGLITVCIDEMHVITFGYFKFQSLKLT
jgi:hypothetical protein